MEKKIKVEKIRRESRSGQCAVVYKVGRVGLFEKMQFEQT